MQLVAPIQSACRQMADLVPGQTGRIAGLVGIADVCHRLLEMGLTRGTLVRVVRAAPLGGPIEVEVRDYRLSMRKSEAAAVLLEAP